MSVTREELAAFADGQLDEPRLGEVAAAVAADPALAAEVERHRAVKARLSAHFAPILDEPIPESLTSLLGGIEPKVADLATAKQRRSARSIPHWGWIVGPALAASLALVVFLPRGTPEGYAEPQLAAVLDDQLVASQPSDAPTRILLSFRNGSGQFCRAYSGNVRGGIACRDAKGWQIKASGEGAATPQADYRTAGSASAGLMAKAQAMAAGPALTASEEEVARANGWR